MSPLLTIRGQIRQSSDRLRHHSASLLPTIRGDRMDLPYQHTFILPPALPSTLSQSAPAVLAALPYTPPVFVAVTILITLLYNLSQRFPAAPSGALLSLQALFAPFITTEDILSTPGLVASQTRSTHQRQPPLSLRTLPTLEALGWSAVALRRALEARAEAGEGGWSEVLRRGAADGRLHLPLLLAVTWVSSYPHQLQSGALTGGLAGQVGALGTELHKPSTSPPFRLLVLFSLLLTTGSVNLIQTIHSADGSSWEILQRAPDVAVCAGLIAVILSMRLGAATGLSITVEVCLHIHCRECCDGQAMRSRAHFVATSRRRINDRRRQKTRTTC